MAQVLLMLLFDIVMYSLLTFYFDHVIPSEFGTALPFYFPLQPSYWKSSGGFSKKKKVAEVNPSFGETLLPASAGGSAASLGPPAVTIRNLRKVAMAHLPRVHNDCYER